MTLSKMISEYNKLLKKYNKQEKWLEANPKKATESNLEAFKKTLGELGLLGYDIEQRLKRKLTIKERLGGLDL